ncbi:MAG: hypothetical protein EZS28_047178 [Streblomastix strix]|uniref:Uncharacterized protein n=1 Tax=Streblomastix strix TaxID=222440 RepID=A0A5J4TFQ8_9EUKA|nr:MAG: hypothetical protein EZS28_047178 [Streblomastix strix]
MGIDMQSDQNGENYTRVITAINELGGAEQAASQLLANPMETQVINNAMKVFRESLNVVSMYDQMVNQVQQQMLAIAQAAQQQMQIQQQQSQQTAAASQVTQNQSSTINAKGIKSNKDRPQRSSEGQGRKRSRITQPDDEEQEIDEQKQEQYQGDDVMIKKQDGENRPFKDLKQKD